MSLSVANLEVLPALLMREVCVTDAEVQACTVSVPVGGEERWSCPKDAALIESLGGVGVCRKMIEDGDLRDGAPCWTAEETEFLESLGLCPSDRVSERTVPLPASSCDISAPLDCDLRAGASARIINSLKDLNGEVVTVLRLLSNGRWEVKLGKAAKSWPGEIKTLSADNLEVLHGIH